MIRDLQESCKDCANSCPLNEWADKIEAFENEARNHHDAKGRRDIAIRSEGRIACQGADVQGKFENGDYSWITCHAEEPKLPDIVFVERFGSGFVSIMSSTGAEITEAPTIELVGTSKYEGGLFIGPEIFDPIHVANLQ
jgi:hypothetical protein